MFEPDSRTFVCKQQLQESYAWSGSVPVVNIHAPGTAYCRWGRYHSGPLCQPCHQYPSCRPWTTTRWCVCCRTPYYGGSACPWWVLLQPVWCYRGLQWGCSMWGTPSWSLWPAIFTLTDLFVWSKMCSSCGDMVDFCWIGMILVSSVSLLNLPHWSGLYVSITFLCFFLFVLVSQQTFNGTDTRIRGSEFVLRRLFWLPVLRLSQPNAESSSFV